MMHPVYYVVGSFRLRYGSVEPSGSVHAESIGNLDNSVFEDAAPRAMFDEDQEQQHEPPPMHRSKSSLGAQSRGTHYTNRVHSGSNSYMDHYLIFNLFLAAFSENW